MTFQNKLRDVADRVDRLIEVLLPEDRGSRLRTAMRYGALGQGKRLRPFFVLESAGLFSVAQREALRVGVALECVHCYSLIHDDLPAMDNDDVRRGRPTCHRAFDEATAILAGDGLLTFAFEILAADETHRDPDVRCALVLALAKASGQGGMVEGQMRDLEAETTPVSSLESVEGIQALKTGALFGYALESGALLGGASQGERASLLAYADKVGLAFQIMDDWLDVTSSPEVLGKATQKDRGAGKATFIDFLGVEGARKKAGDLVEGAISCLEPFGGRAQGLEDAARFVISRNF